MAVKISGKKLKRNIEIEIDNVLDQTCTTNTPSVRQLIRIAHYCNLLKKQGNEPHNASRVYRMTSGCIQKAVESSEEKHRDIVDLSLIDEHTRTWNMAMYYFERGQKSLCQMMITTMDYILQEKSGLTILYKGKDRASYYNYVDEMNDLNADYLDAVYYESAYDYCTERLSEYLEIKEYKDIANERLRLINSGMPDRVQMSIDLLKEVAGKEKFEYFVNVEFCLHPRYDVNLLKEAYRKSISGYTSEQNAMSVYAKVVVDTAGNYAKLIKEH